METASYNNEPINIEEVTEMATWNRERSLEERRSFVEGRYAALGEIALDIVVDVA